MIGVFVKIVLALYMLFILFVSLVPGAEPIPGVWQIDKLYHLLAYALMSFLWVCMLLPAVSLGKGVSVPARAIGAAFVISTLFGVIMELLQQFSSSREASFFDAAANAVGALAGVVVAGWALKVFGRRSSKMEMRGG